MLTIPTDTDKLDSQTVAALYNTDLFAWASLNAELLRDGKYQKVDMAHLIEEIEDMGKSEQRSLASHLRNLLMHLLKWQYQADIDSRSWQSSIINARLEIARLLKDSPSLNRKLFELLNEEYAAARRLASVETTLAIQTFPEVCTYQPDQILSEDWLP